MQKSLDSTGFQRAFETLHMQSKVS